MSMDLILKFQGKNGEGQTFLCSGLLEIAIIFQYLPVTLPLITRMLLLDPANKAIGAKSTPVGYTWHHVEDGLNMMLVPTDLHQAVRHTGGVSLTKKGFFN